MKSLSSWERVVVANVGGFFILGIGLAIFNTPYFDQVYSVEDGFLEWLTFAALLHIALVSWWRFVVFAKAWANRSADVRQPSKRFLASVFLCALVFTFGFGEEISWGQRLFNIESGGFFAQYNLQGETNLHNLMLGEVKINKLVFGKGVALFFLLYLLVLTPLYWLRPGVRTFIDSFGVPVPKKYQWLMFLIILLGVEVVIKHFSETGRRGELTEFAAAFTVLLVIFFPLNKQLYAKS